MSAPAVFLDPDARQEGAARPRMVARPVQAAVGIEVVQSAQDLDLVLDLLERLQGPGELEVLSLPFGPPMTLMHAVGDVDKGHPQRGARRRGRQRAGLAGGRREQASARRVIQRREGPAKHPRPAGTCDGESLGPLERRQVGYRADGLVSWLHSALDD